MKDAKGLRKGFTTGSCAAAAAKASAYMLLFGNRINSVSIMTPGGLTFDTGLYDICMEDDHVSCAVKKDSGDDPDVTNGILIYAKVSRQELPVNDHFKDESDDDKGFSVEISGGEGIGIVTAPGLDQPVGNHAINSVPRKMITNEVSAVAELAGFLGVLNVEISVPDGVKLAEKTFNPKLGIKGGISIIGTSGIVEPMSTKALLDTIRLELKQRKELGYEHAVITPGNYGRELVMNEFGYDIDKSIKCSNYIGDTLDMAKELGFKKLLLAGHIGKLIKVAGGIMNTHSREADCRMEILTSVALLKGTDPMICKKIMECVTTEEAVRLLHECGKLDCVMEEVTDRVLYHLNDRIKRDYKGALDESDNEELGIDTLIYNNEYGILGKSKGVKEWFTLLAQERERKI